MLLPVLAVNFVILDIMSAKENLELKKYCNNFEEIRKVLINLGAKKEIVKNQKDYFFDLPQKKQKNNGRLKLRIEDNQNKELIYYERPDFQEGLQAQSLVKLYTVHDNDILPFLLESLGEIGIVEKKREVWRLNNTVFHLDSVVDVGDIFEIELQKEGSINTVDQKLFAHYQALVDPFLGEIIAGSNIDLILNNKKKLI